MFWRCSSVFWLFQAFSLLILLEVSVPTESFNVTQAPKKPTEEDVREKVDSTVIYMIVCIIFVFVITITMVAVISVWQTRHSPKRRDGSTWEDPDFDKIPRNTSQTGTSSSKSIGEEASGAYEQDPIPGALEPLEPRAWWEIGQNRLFIKENEPLGSGQFGMIYLGEVIKDNGRKEKCAVKTLKQGASEAEKRSLKIELQNMSTMDPHPNIVNLIGAQTQNPNGVLYVVVEYCVNGDLYNYVKKHRTDLSSIGRKESGTSIEYIKRLKIAFDIANGMNYLSTRGFIHRDLAARNVLLDGQMKAKVSDFGRSRDIKDTYEVFQSVRKNEPIPTRWMPVETLRHHIFTKQSDIWSFGVLLWEIESGGTRPYNDDTTYRQVVDRVVYQGYRLPQPHNCPDVIYQIMQECWKIDPEERPTFNQIAVNLGHLLQAHLVPASPQCDLPNFAC